MRISHGTFVLVADGAKWLLFRNEGDQEYVVLKTVEHKEWASRSTREQGSDAPGRAFNSTSPSRSAYSETDWHQQDEDRFAIDTAESLRHAVAGGKGGIVVIAPPRTLGVLRTHYGPAIEERLIAEIAKDLVGHSSDDIGAAIAAYGQ
jgi:protein required for attachment to host cells